MLKTPFNPRQVQVFGLPDNAQSVRVQIQKSSQPPELVIDTAGEAVYKNKDIIVVVPDSHETPNPKLAETLQRLHFRLSVPYPGGNLFLLHDDHGLFWGA